MTGMERLREWFEERRGKLLRLTRVDADEVPFPRNESFEFVMRDDEPRFWESLSGQGVTVSTGNRIYCYSTGDAVTIDGDSCVVDLTTGSGRKFLATYEVV